MKQEPSREAQIDYTQEQQRVQEVTEQLHVRLEELEQVTGSVMEELQELRGNFWEQVSIDFSTINDAIESHASMKQHAETLSERERRHRHAEGEARRVRRLIRSPYFGRIDVQEHGEPGSEHVYIGIAGFVDDTGEKHLIYDWRAPVCSLYYDYVPGPCAYETPGGSIAAELLLKRQFVVRDGCLELMFDTGVTIGDELLQQVLSRTSDLQMKSIVATIQREQNRIIRNDRARMLVVQGVAGSGKTSAALQRAAYLLYKHRDRLQADQLLLFSPNPLFSSYIASVLPELGEENMRQTTFQSYLAHRLGGEFELEDSYAQLESLLADGEDDWSQKRAEWCSAAGEGGRGEGSDGREAAAAGASLHGRIVLRADGEAVSGEDGLKAVFGGSAAARDERQADDEGAGETGEDEPGAGTGALSSKAAVDGSDWWLTDADWWLIGAEWWLMDAETDSQPEASGGAHCSYGDEGELEKSIRAAEMSGMRSSEADSEPELLSMEARRLRKEERPNEQAVRLAGIRLKSSAAFVERVQTYAKLLETAFMRFCPLQFDEEVLVSAGQMEDIFYRFDPAIRLPNRVEMLRDWLLERLAEREAAELAAPWVEDEVELLDAEEYRRAYRELREARAGFDYYEQEQKLLARYVVRRRFQPLRERVKRLAFVDVKALYVQLFADAEVQRRLSGEAESGSGWPEAWPDVCRQTLERLALGRLAYEDAAPYLFLRELALGFATSSAVRHVFIDEAQDYSPFQLELLKRLFPRCRMTALGDMNQAIYAHASALETDSAQGFAALYGPEQTEEIRLQRSYRSTQEIVLFTRGMVPEGHAIEPFTRGGAKPRVTVAADRGSLHRRLAARAAELAEGGCATVAILCKTAGESEFAAAALRSRLPQLRLVTRHSPSMEPGVLVLPSYLAKGVEFDAVLIYDGSGRRYARERDRRLLYTACTRAMHELHMFTLGAPSPFITAQPAETYELEQ